MKKIMGLYFLLLCAHSVCMDDDRGSINSLDVYCKEVVKTFSDLRQVIDKNQCADDVLEGYIIKPRAIAEYLFFHEIKYKTVDQKIFNSFKILHKKYPDYYQLCVEQLVQEIYQQRNNKTHNNALDIQAQFQRMLVKNIENMNTKIEEIQSLYDERKKHYQCYMARAGLCALITGAGFAGIGYLSWLLNNCLAQ